MIRKLLLALAGTALAPAAAQAEWVEASSKHFLVYGDMSQQQARDWAERLERFDHFLRGITGAREEPGAMSRVTVYVVPSMGAVQDLAGLAGVGGFYRPDAQGALAVTPQRIDPRYKVGPQEVLLHEYTHHMLFGSTNARHPAWVHEGMAEFFGTARPDAQGNLVIGAPPEMRGYSLTERYQMTAEELLTSSDRKLSQDELPHMYARGWLLVHYLMMNKARAGQFGKYLTLVERGVPSLEAGKQAFGDLRKLDGELNVYVRSTRFPIGKIPPSELAAGPIQVRQLRPCEARIMPVRVRSAVGVTEKTAPGVAEAARKAAAGCENDPFVQRTLAETEFDAKANDAALAAAERALALDPQNIMAMVYKGRVFARKGNWAEARKWFIKANRLDPNYALPLVLYYDSFALAGQKPTDAAMKGLLRAAAIVPQDASVRLRAVRALLVEGDVEGARTVLAPLAYGPHQKPDSAPRRLLRMLETGSDAKTVLAAADKEKWNEIGKE